MLGEAERLSDKAQSVLSDKVLTECSNGFSKSMHAQGKNCLRMRSAFFRLEMTEILEEYDCEKSVQS